MLLPFEFLSRATCLEVTYKKSGMIPGILDIRINTRDSFAAAKTSTNWPDKVFDDESIPVSVSQFLCVM